MDKALNEIGKLRSEMKIGFIELENQIQANGEIIRDEMELLRQKVQQSSESTIKIISKLSSNMEKGFLAVEGALDKDINEIRSEIKGIKKRLDQGNL